MIDAYRVITAGDPLSGNGYIAGKLRVNNTLAARRIYLTDRTTYRLVAVTFSDESGNYRFDGVSTDNEFDLRAQDWARNRLDAILSAVKAKPYV